MLMPVRNEQHLSTEFYNSYLLIFNVYYFIVCFHIEIGLLIA